MAKKDEIKNGAADNAAPASNADDVNQVPEAVETQQVPDDQVPEAVETQQVPDGQASEAEVQAEQAEFEQCIVKCDGFVCLNVRPEPKFGGKPLRTIKNGAEVMVKPAADGWFELEDGGYVKAEYLV